MARPRKTALNATSLAKQYHSIVFDDTYNTYENYDADSEYSWHLIPSTRPVFNPPEQKIITADKAGSHGVIDLSEALSGEPIFNNRTGSIEFYVENGHGSWAAKMSKISNILNGRVRKAVLTDDPAYYYYGRFRVNNWKSDKWWSVISVDYDVFPFKYELIEANKRWLWDPFSFETGVIREIPGRVLYSGDEFSYICPGYSSSGKDVTETNYWLRYNHTNQWCDTYIALIGSALSAVPVLYPSANCEFWLYDPYSDSYVPEDRTEGYPLVAGLTSGNVYPEAILRQGEYGYKQWICIRNRTTSRISISIKYHGGSL